MIDIEDEISFVLHEFRQSCSQSTTLVGATASVGIISTKNSSSNSTTIKNNRSHRGHFSDVRYYRKTRSIAVSYLFDKVLLFDFEISLLLLDVDVVDVDVDGADDDKSSKSISNRYRKYYIVTYKADAHQYECYSSSSSTKNCISNNSISNMKEKISILKQRVQIICDDLNHRLEEEEEEEKKNQTKNKNKNRNNNSSNNNNQLRSSTTTSSSLFAVMSKLLLSLNNLQTELIFFQPNNNNNNNEKDSTLVVRPMTDRERSSHISYLSAKKKRTTATTVIATAATAVGMETATTDSVDTVAV